MIVSQFASAYPLAGRGAQFTPAYLSAGLGATDSLSIIGVRELQKQLRRLAVERERYEIDPAQYDGTMSLGTILAMANAASTVAGGISSQIHPVIGKIVDVFGALRGGLSKIPYAGQVLSVVFSPWLIDEVWGALLGIMRVIPGGSSTANALQASINGIKPALAAAAGPIAAALALIPKPPPSGLGAYAFHTGYQAPVFYAPATHGPLGFALGFWNPVAAFVDVVQDAAGSVVDVVQDAAGNLANFAGDAAKAIQRGAATAWDYTSKAAKAVWQATAASVTRIYNDLKKYGCMIVNNDILVTAVATGVGFVATPAASAAVVVGAQAGKAGCAVLAIAELVYAIIKLLAQKFRGPAPLTTPTGAALPVQPGLSVLSRLSRLRLDAMTSAPPMSLQPATALRLMGRAQAVVEGQLLLPATPTFKIPKPTYAQCFVRYNRSRKLFAIYCPTSAGTGLGEAPAGTALVAEVATRGEAGAAAPLPDETDPALKRPWFWIAVIGGATVIGGALVLTTRNRS